MTWKKTGGPNFFAQVWNQRKRMFLPSTTGGRKETTWFEGVGKKMWRSKDRELNTSQEDVKSDKKFQPPFWGEVRKGTSYIRCEPVKIKPTNKHVRRTRKYRKRIQGVYQLSLSFHDMHVVSFCPTNAVDSTFIFSFFLPATTYKL